MKAYCLQGSLSGALDVVGRAASPRSTLPILQNVMLAADDGRLRLSATDMQIGIHCWIGARVDEADGPITVPARTLSDLVKTFPADEQVRLGVSEDLALTLDHPQGKARIKGMDAKEFPAIPVPDGGPGVRLEAEALRTAITRVAFAAAANDNRIVLNGVLVAIEGDHVTLAAADGFRLSVCRIPLAEAVAEPYSVIVPAPAMVEAGRLCAGQQEPVALTVTPEHNRIIFQFTDAVLASQLIDGNFPDYGKIIPEGYKTRTVVNTDDLLRACRTAQVFARDNGHQIVRLQVQPGSSVEVGRMVVAADSVVSGNGVSELDADVAGDAVVTAFNVRYLMAVLPVIATPQVALETTLPSSPGVLHPVGEEDAFTHVIMPMAVTDQYVAQQAEGQAASGVGGEVSADGGAEMEGGEAAKSGVASIYAQYCQIKAQHPDAILFFRSGDFYEAFDADAQTAARELDLVLTSRQVADDGLRAPMAAVPYHAIERCVARLTEKGYHVGVAEPVGEDANAGCEVHVTSPQADAVGAAEESDGETAAVEEGVPDE